MSLNYIYTFEKHGMLAPSSGALQNEIWIDVGNTLGMGLFDHHQGEECSSAFSTILNHPEFLKNLKMSAQEGRDILVHIHEAPDMDCISSLWLVKNFLELTSEEYDALSSSDVVEKFSEYVSCIDEGRGKNTTYPTLYAIFSNIGENVKDNNVDISKLIVTRGLELISFAADCLKIDPSMDLFSYDFYNKLSSSFAEEIALIEEAQAEYRRDKEGQKISFSKVEVWTKDSNLEAIETAIWTEATKSSNGYDFARKEDNILTVYPYSTRDDNGSYTRVMASINPDIDIEKKYTLKPLAEIIEQMEQIEETFLFKQDGRYRRDYSRPRADKGHFSQSPFAVTSNPWCIAVDESYIDAPYGGSLISYDDIVDLIKNNGSVVKRTYGLSYKWMDGNSDVKADYDQTGKAISLSRFQEDVKNPVSDGGMRIVFAEIDSSLIRHNNEMLKAICMNIAGGTYHECRDDQFLFLDYRTVIYADQSFIIILAATSKKKDGMTIFDSNYDQLSISKYIDTTNIDKFLSSPLIREMIEIVDLRNKMVDTGRATGNTDLNDRKAIEVLNKEMLQLSLEHQKLSIRDSYIEKSVYAFLNDKYELEKIKSSNMEETGVLVNEARDKMVSKFNTLSAFAVPFILIATVFQMGIIKFQELASVTGVAADIGWCVVIILIAFLIYLLGKNSKK